MEEIKKTLIYFTKGEFKIVKKAKGELTWHDWVLKCAEEEIKFKEEIGEKINGDN